jgi:ABC-type transport system involved in cytochrome bd biosynthesis fused ATPase/permease subunit
MRRGPLESVNWALKRRNSALVASSERNVAMSKNAAALVAAVLISICAGAAIFMVGGAALLNRTGVTPSNSSAKSPGASDVALVERTQLEQMQVQILQYQAREQQYQQREQQYRQVLDEAQAQVQAAQAQEQQMQMLLNQLQQRGLISVGPDGTILVNQ